VLSLGRCLCRFRKIAKSMTRAGRRAGLPRLNKHVERSPVIGPLMVLAVGRLLTSYSVNGPAAVQLKADYVVTRAGISGCAEGPVRSACTPTLASWKYGG
jgi:hypothetical protein